MFCEKCGKENPAGVQFCDGCGAPLNAAPAAEKAKGKFPIAKILKIAIPVVVIALVAVFVVNLFGGNVYEKTIEKYLNAQYNNDGAALKEVVCDEFFYEFLTRKEKEGKPGLGLDEDYVDFAFRKVAGVGPKENYKNSVSTDYVTTFEDKEIEEIAEWLESYEVGEGESKSKVKYDYDPEAIDDVVIFEYRLDSVSHKDGYSKNINDFGEEVLIKVNGKWYVSPLLDRDTIYGYYNGYEYIEGILD
ncbi:MAG: zinc-ribbon domain-containing protein [Clostridia bacterium]|nr:zinc-ribbon domain-containing protein [Clostridia bacterium]